MQVTEKSVLSLGIHGFHRVAYREWGDADNDLVLLCLHGLSRLGRDFDLFAAALADHYRVACPDLPGCGRSQWLSVHDDYTPSVYAADMAMLIARLGVDEIDWVGTSLGGIVGMMLAAMPDTPIRKLVLNDVGAFTSKSAFERFSDKFGTDPLFADVAAAEAYLRDAFAALGSIPDEHWTRFTEVSLRPDAATGGWRLHYDPGLAAPIKKAPMGDVDIWAVWDQVSCPVLILRGEQSDTLLPETAQEMLVRGPDAELIEFADVGHVPLLMDPVQVDAVREWLLRP